MINTKFKNAVKIPWLPSNVVKTDKNWLIPVDELRMGNDWYLEKYKLICEALPGSVIIDAGCKTGDWVGLINHIPLKDVIKIGVDPIRYNLSWNCYGQWDYYHQCAIDNIEETTAYFNIFDEPGCNSLLDKSEHLTMRTNTNSILVPVQTLESVLLTHVAPDTVIHYLKCDCQGKDVDVVKSLRSFLLKTKYVQIETSFDKNKPFYVNQPDYEADILAMAEIGFEPIYYMEYLESPLPEGEILFKNTNF